MRSMQLPGGAGGRLVIMLMAGAFVALGWGGAPLAAGPINPKVYKTKFDAAKKDAEVVAHVRVLAAVCKAVAGQGKQRTATLELALQVLEAEKGSVKKNDVLVVSHKVNLPAGPGPGMYGYWASLSQFPFTPGVQGDVALRWDREGRRYTAVAGWVATPNRDPRAIPTEVGKAVAAGETPPGR